MSKPVRIQRKRSKGWKMPANTVYVGRPSKWGNPWAIGENGPMDRTPNDNEGAVGLFRDMLADEELRTVCAYPSDITELRGKNLACWCSTDKLCHADVLLELANGGGDE